MKKFFMVAAFMLGIMVTTSAQNIARDALGVRFGNNDGFGGEISYQHELGEITRLEVDLGFRDRANDNNAFKLTGVYQWVWNIDQGFNWYVGFGAGVGSWNNNKVGSNVNDGLFVNADGNIGVEYNFDIPLLISLDFRPEFGIIGDYNDTGIDLALSLRYQFY